MTGPGLHDQIVREALAIVRSLEMPARGRDLEAWLRGVFPFYAGITLPCIPADRRAHALRGKVLYGLWNTWVDDEIDVDGTRAGLDASLAVLCGHAPAHVRGAGALMQCLLADLVGAELDRIEIVRMDLFEIGHGFAYEWAHQREPLLQNAREYLRYSTMTLSLKIFLDLDLLHVERAVRAASYRALRLAYDDLSVGMKLASDVGSLRREVTTEDSANLIRLLAVEHGLDDRPRAGEGFEGWRDRIGEPLREVVELAAVHLARAETQLAAVRGIDTARVARTFRAVFDHYASGRDMR